MVVVSAVSFGTLSIFAKLAYNNGLGTEQLLAFRFALAAIGMLALSFAVGQNPLRLSRRQAASLVTVGGVLYTLQAMTYFIALRTLPASLAVLIVYIYPSLVVIAGWLFLRRRVSRWHVGALVASFAGVILLVGGAQFQLGTGLIFAFAAPLMYTTFILISERVMAAVPDIITALAATGGTSAITRSLIRMNVVYTSGAAKANISPMPSRNCAPPTRRITPAKLATSAPTCHRETRRPRNSQAAITTRLG